MLTNQLIVQPAGMSIFDQQHSYPAKLSFTLLQSRKICVCWTSTKWRTDMSKCWFSTFPQIKVVSDSVEFCLEVRRLAELEAGCLSLSLGW